MYIYSDRLKKPINAIDYSLLDSVIITVNTRETNGELATIKTSLPACIEGEPCRVILN